MSDQAIIALVLGAGTVFTTIFWFLLKAQSNAFNKEFGKVVSEIHQFKASIEEKLDMIEDKMASFDKSLAIKSMVIDYINKEIDCLKAAFKRD